MEYNWACLGWTKALSDAGVASAGVADSLKAHHTKNFDLYVESLEILVPWFFALGMPGGFPHSISKEMLGPPKDSKCLCVVVFSSMPLDQDHEQNYKSVGAVGHIKNPGVLRTSMGLIDRDTVGTSWENHRGQQPHNLLATTAHSHP